MQGKIMLCDRQCITLILRQEKGCSRDINVVQATIKKSVKSERRRVQTDEARSLHDELPPKLQRAMVLGSEKGASSWLMKWGCYSQRAVVVDLCILC